MVATRATIAVLMTADTHTALPVSARTPKASATGAMELPAREIDCPAKNHRKAGERSGPDAVALGTCRHDARTGRMLQCFCEELGRPGQGRLLDVGCGHVALPHGSAAD